MKKIIALALTVMMVAALAVSASAYFLDRNEGGALIEKTINKGYTPVVIDGVMSEGEYAKVNVDFNKDVSIAIPDEAMLDAVSATMSSDSLYMSYDENYLYFFITTTAEGFHNGCDDNHEAIWGQYAIQISLADVADDDASMRFEGGYALSSDTGALLHRIWSDGQGIGYEDACIPGTDYVVTKANGLMNYEVRIPYEAFQAKKTGAEGDKIRLCIVWATGASEDDLTDQYMHTQFAYGCTGDPGKDVTGHAVMTLGAALEAPVVEEAPAEAGVDGEVAEVVVATPVTADAGIVVAVAVMAVAAGVVLSKKH